MKDIIEERKRLVSKPNSFYTNYVKVTLDLIMALFLLIITFPILLIVSLVIKFTSKGPVIFSQPRIGKFGEEFKIYKFRTMYTHFPNQGKSPNSSSDPRITKVGVLLRKTSLDELPQLINIIKGQMSFVGPRPEQKMIVDQYYTDFERQRFAVKPGITGIWQLSMDRTKPIHENLHHDFKYINNISFIEDIKIILKTINVMINSNTN
jgi:undecaprenyl phosphate N,N'-diacetylbacillosamine 1-phosphate transferase